MTVVVGSDFDRARVDRCAQCGRMAVGALRDRTDNIGRFFGRVFVCFDCMAPEVRWQYNPYSERVISTPVYEWREYVKRRGIKLPVIPEE